MVNFLKNVRLLVFTLGIGLLGAVQPVNATDSTYVRFNTNFGNIDVLMLSDEAPKTVANFLSYAESNPSAYANALIHRAIPGFVIQGGEYTTDANGNLTAVPLHAAVQGEPGVSNTRGTIAMALMENVDGTTPASKDTGTDQFFFNLVDNTSLDTLQPETGTNPDGTVTHYDSGPFTVFGVVVNASSLAVMDAIGNVNAASGLYDVTFPSPVGELDDFPLVNYSNTANPVTRANYVIINSITR